MTALIALFAADLTGTWTGQYPGGRDGAMVDIAVQLVQEGSKLTGKLYGDYQSFPISGVVSQELVTFVVAGAEQAGNQINTSRIRFTGRLANGELEVIRERESVRDAVNGAAAQPRQGPKVAIRLKRLP